MESFMKVSAQVLVQGTASIYYEGGTRFNLHTFWAEYKAMLPLHHAVYLADVACKKAASANVESVFSGAGKFTEEAPSGGELLLSYLIKLHYNWRYSFLQPSNQEIIDRYNIKFRPTFVARRAATASAAAATASAAAAAIAAQPCPLPPQPLP